MDLFWAARWGELYAFFSQGEPPLAVQLLAFNTIFFVLWILRRMRDAPALRSGTANVVQVLLIAANVMILFQKDIEHLLKQFS
jgi:hypothetical protein